MTAQTRSAAAAATPAAAIAPVVRAVTVALPPAAAFDLFTREMRVWWPLASHSCGGADALDVQFDPRVGGSVVEVGRNGQRWPWGTVTEWRAPHAFAMTWHPGFEPEAATTLRVRFTACAAGTEVEVHHGGWESRAAHAQARRDNYDSGWPRVLQSYARAAVVQGAG